MTVAFRVKLTRQGVQGLQAFTFFVATVNNKHTKLGSKESVGVKYKDGICAKLSLKL